MTAIVTNANTLCKRMFYLPQMNTVEYTSSDANVLSPLTCSSDYGSNMKATTSHSEDVKHVYDGKPMFKKGTYFTHQKIFQTPLYMEDINVNLSNESPSPISQKRGTLIECTQQFLNL